MSAKEIGENTTRKNTNTTAIFHDKFTLWYIKQTIYIYKKKFTSHKQCLFDLLFFEKPNKTLTDRSTLQVVYSF